jgi:DNA-binding response OmpR family regulator
MVGTKLLVVDDDPNICDILKTHFEKEGCEVLTASDGVEGLSAFRAGSPDLVLLDIMLPKMDGQQVLAEIRKESQKPVIMVTAKGEVFDKVLGLEMGADDFVVKPFDLKELSARVKAVLRRYRSHLQLDEGDVIKFENFEISQEKFELKLKGKKVDIPPKELQLLYCLASNPNRVFSRELLLEHVWDFAFLGDSRTVDVHIKRLREKLEGVSDKWALKTVWGIGYKFELYN